MLAHMWDEFHPPEVDKPHRTARARAFLKVHKLDIGRARFPRLVLLRPLPRPRPPPAPLEASLTERLVDSRDDDVIAILSSDVTDATLAAVANGHSMGAARTAAAPASSSNLRARTTPKPHLD